MIRQYGNKKGKQVFYATAKKRGLEPAQEGEQEGKPFTLNMEERSMIIECPFCEQEFNEEDVQLYEDDEGQYYECPYCESTLELDEYVDPDVKRMRSYERKRKAAEFLGKTGETAGKAGGAIKAHPKTAAGIGAGIAAAALARKLYKRRKAKKSQQEDVIECPHCNESFVDVDGLLLEDDDGDFLVCPFCEGAIEEVSKERKMELYKKARGMGARKMKQRMGITGFRGQKSGEKMHQTLTRMGREVGAPKKLAKKLVGVGAKYQAKQDTIPRYKKLLSKEPGVSKSLYTRKGKKGPWSLQKQFQKGFQKGAELGARESGKSEENMSEDLIFELFENLMQVPDSQVDVFVDGLTEEEATQLYDYMEMVEAAEEDAEILGTAEGIIEGIAAGELDASEVADAILGIGDVEEDDLEEKDLAFKIGQKAREKAFKAGQEYKRQKGHYKAAVKTGVDAEMKARKSGLTRKQARKAGSFATKSYMAGIPDKDYAKMQRTARIGTAAAGLAAGLGAYKGVKALKKRRAKKKAEKEARK